MRTDEVTMLMGEDGAGAALMVRRLDGQFAFGCIDTRIAHAARAAAMRGVVRGLAREPQDRTLESRLIEIRRD